MKNSAINNLGYTGIVTISQYNGNKKKSLAQVHNSGYSSLFSFLSYCLTGDFDMAKLELPTKIRLLYTEESKEGTMTFSAVSPFIFFANRPEIVYTDTTEASSAVCYSFIIPREMVENAHFNGIGLYSDTVTESASDVESFSAFCKVDDLSGFSESTMLVVDWKLIIVNNDNN